MPRFDPLPPNPQVKQQLEAVDARGDGWWVVFGDSAFALSRNMQRQLRGTAKRTAAGSFFNQTMGCVCISIENRFAELLNTWGYVGYKRDNHFGAVPVARQVSVATLLQICRGIWYGNQMTSLMGAPGSALRETLSVQSFLARAG